MSDNINVIGGIDGRVSRSDLERAYRGADYRLRADSGLREMKNPNVRKQRIHADAVLFHDILKSDFDEEYRAGTWHYDSNATVGAFERALEFLDPDITVIEDEDKQLPTGTVIPMRYDNDELVEWYVHTQVETVGSFRRGSPNTTDFPLTNAVFTEWRDPIYCYVGAYMLERNEAARWARAMMGRGSIDIVTLKERTLQKAAMNTLNALMAYGDLEIGLPGWLTHPETMKLEVATPITVDSDCEDDLTTLNLAARTTERFELYRIQKVKVDTIALSFSTYQILMSKPYVYTPNGGTTVGNTEISVLDRFLKINPSIKSVIWLTELDLEFLAAAGLAADREYIIGYRRNPQYFRWQMTSPFVTPMPPKDIWPGGILRASFFNTAGLLQYYKNCQIQVLLPAG